jgi:peptidyl-prolyl cis-trans isomerase SurA
MISISVYRAAGAAIALLVATGVMMLAEMPVAQAQSVAAMVNGEPITNFDIDQRTKLTVLSTRKTPSRKEVLQELIDEKLKVREGKRYSVDPGAAEIDAAYASMGSRMNLSAEALTQSLASRGIRPDTLKSRIRAEMVWSGLVRGRFQQSLMVGEKTVESTIQLNDSNKDAADSFQYVMRPLVLLVPRGGNPAARRAEAEALRGRIRSCEEAVRVFRAMRNAAVRAAVTRTSAELPPPLRAVLDKTPVGQLTPPEMTKHGVEMVALCERKATVADSPEKRAVRDKLFAQKFEAKSKTYLEKLRKQALIEYR